MSQTQDGDSGAVRVGLLHSLSGTMAISERALLDVEQMTLDEINAAGGVLGRRIEPVVADGESTPTTFARRARELLESGVDTLFGCWTSASRKAVKPVVEALDGLLWYPVQYEGLEQSRHIVYTGSCLNQQITPATEWAMDTFGPRVFLIGSDYVFPRTANLLVRALVERRGSGEIVAERYIPLGDPGVDPVIEAIVRSKPDVVFNTLNGDSNLAFFRGAHGAGLTPETTPIISVSVSENEVQSVAAEAAGHYACWNYFQSLDTEDNRAFVERFQRRYGRDRACSAPMLLSWYQLQLWKQAVEAAGSFDAPAVREQLAGRQIAGPAGAIAIQDNHHVTLPAHVGRGTADGQFEIVWSSDEPIDPLPWLGVEEMDFPATPLVREALAAYPEAIHLSAELDARVRERTHDLARANEALKAEFLDRQRAEELVNQQAREILEVSTPVIPLWEGLVLMPLIGTMDSARAADLTQRLLEGVDASRARVALVDITGVPYVDTQTANHLVESFRAVRLLGGQVIVTGVRPAIAQTLVHLGVDLSEFSTYSTLAAGLDRARALLDGGLGGDPGP